MGWLFSSNLRSKAELIKHLTEENVAPNMKTIAKAVRGNVLWAVHEYLVDSGTYKAGTRWIGCYLMGADQGWWGSKDMDESMGPCEKSCPVKFLDMVPDPGGYATEWRAKVRALAAKKAVKLQVGSVVKLIPGCKVFGDELKELTITSVRPLEGQVGFTRIHIRRSLIAEVLPPSSPAPTPTPA